MIISEREVAPQPVPRGIIEKHRPSLQDDRVTPQSVPRGVIDLSKCVSIKGAEDTIMKPCSFEIATASDSMFFIADDDKQKEDWINTVGKAIVRHSRALVSSSR